MNIDGHGGWIRCWRDLICKSDLQRIRSRRCIFWHCCFYREFLASTCRYLCVFWLNFYPFPVCYLLSIWHHQDIWSDSHRLFLFVLDRDRHFFVLASLQSQVRVSGRDIELCEVLCLLHARDRTYRLPFLDYNAATNPCGCKNAHGKHRSQNDRYSIYYHISSSFSESCLFIDKSDTILTCFVINLTDRVIILKDNDLFYLISILLPTFRLNRTSRKP